jgi:hypothetical protein
MLLVFALSSGANWLEKVMRGPHRRWGGDEVSAYERRLEPLRARLPPHGMIGYLSDPEPARLSRSQSREHYKKFILTKYALAPVLVVNRPTMPLVVGNFDDPVSAEQARHLGLELVTDFENGILLFRRRAQ